MADNTNSSPAPIVWELGGVSSNPNLDAVSVAVIAGSSQKTIRFDDPSLATGLQTIYDMSPDLDNPLPLNKDLVSEFEDRYISFDLLQTAEDGSDLAYVRVLSFSDGKFGKQIFPLVNDKEVKYKEFIVTSCQNAFMDKTQILKTNNTLQVYAFDSQPEVLNIQGVLKSTVTDRWDISMVLIWDELLRVTKLIQRKMICEFGYESSVYWGYPLSFTYQKSSNTQYLVSFAMQFLIIKRSVALKVGSLQLESVISQLNSIGKA